MAAKKRMTALDKAYSEAFKDFTKEIFDLVKAVNNARTELENSQRPHDGSFEDQGPIETFEKAEEALKRQIENIPHSGANASLSRTVRDFDLKIRAVEVELVRQPRGKGRIKAVIVKGLICRDGGGQGENYSSQSSRHP